MGAGGNLMSGQSMVDKSSQHVKLRQERAQKSQEETVLHDYLLERRRALLTELRQIEKMLDLEASR